MTAARHAAGTTPSSGTRSVSAHELCVLAALRDAIRRREVWVVGASRWRDPESDLPADFEVNRDEHYAAIRAPLDATQFISELKGRSDTA